MSSANTREAWRRLNNRHCSQSGCRPDSSGDVLFPVRINQTFNFPCHWCYNDSTSNNSFLHSSISLNGVLATLSTTVLDFSIVLEMCGVHAALSRRFFTNHTAPTCLTSISSHYDFVVNNGFMMCVASRTSRAGRLRSQFFVQLTGDNIFQPCLQSVKKLA